MLDFVEGVLMTMPDDAYWREGIGPSVQAVAPGSLQGKSTYNYRLKLATSQFPWCVLFDRILIGCK